MYFLFAVSFPRPSQFLASLGNEISALSQTFTNKICMCWGKVHWAKERSEFMHEKDHDLSLSRREILESAGALAAGGLLIAGAAKAADAEDNTSSIRITALKATPVGPKAFVKIETNHQVTGWGEVTGSEPK